jgi:ADP-ribosyl-[dinitrogen reductase] hydrolase
VTHDHDLVDRMLGCLFGGAVGDGFGYAIEFDSLTEIIREHGADGLAEPVLKQGRLIVSDDTQMTLFTAQAVVQTGGLLQNLRRSYLDWYLTQTHDIASARNDGLLHHRALWARRAPGNTCLSALAQGGQGSRKSRINNSKGCGGVMRVAPIAFDLSLSEDIVFEKAAEAAAITHGHPSGFLSAGALAVIVHNLLKGVDPMVAVTRPLELLSAEVEGGETLKALLDAITTAATDVAQSVNARDCAANMKRLGEGWVGEEALAIAVYSIVVAHNLTDELECRTTGFKTVVRIASNHSGDSDSTGSIAGQLHGACHGLSQLPWEWIEPLDVFDAICDVAQQLTTPYASPTLSRLVIH